jgi:hypothetical protein
MTAGDEQAFVAYELVPGTGLLLEPAPATREWMSRTSDGFAQRCLPLLIANQSGWIVRNTARFRATWNGGRDKDAIALEYLDPVPPYAAMSHFGEGIITWSLPWLFRTPPGYNLAVRGTPNWPKDGAWPLEGIVESDWSSATFTMNWQLTRPGLSVRFDVGDPICFLAPIARGEVERFDPQVIAIGDEPAERAAFAAWSQDRSGFLRDLKEPGSEAEMRGWQKDYFRGRTPTGPAPQHQTRLKVRPFRKS